MIGEARVKSSVGYPAPGNGYANMRLGDEHQGAAGVKSAGNALVIVCLAAMGMITVADQTVMATALPRIAADFRVVGGYTWASNAYLLCFTVALPIMGSLGDVRGRRRVLLQSLSLFLVGSMMCGTSGVLEWHSDPMSGWLELVFSRGVQGIGAAGVFTTAFSVAGELYPASDHGKIFGLLGSAMGVAAICGPLIGGLLADLPQLMLGPCAVVGWRLIFLVNVPVGFTVYLLLTRTLPRRQPARKLRADFRGGLLCVTSFVPLLLAITLIGQGVSRRIGVVLMAGGLVSLALLTASEMRAESPILPLRLLRQKAFAVSNVIGFLSGAGYVGMIMFIPLYMQAVQGASAAESGIGLAPLLGATIVSGPIASALAAKHSLHRAVVIASMCGSCGACALVAAMGSGVGVYGLCARLTIFGLAFGPVQALLIMIVQQSVEAKEIGSVTGMLQFVQQMGAVIGVGVFGVIFSQVVAAGVTQGIGKVTSVQNVQGGVTVGELTPTELRRSIRERVEREYSGIKQAAMGGSDGGVLAGADPALVRYVTSLRTKAPVERVRMLAQLHHAMDSQADTVADRMARRIQTTIAAGIKRVLDCTVLLYAIGSAASCAFLGQKPRTA